jgi:hypothetical protein
MGWLGRLRCRDSPSPAGPAVPADQRSTARVAEGAVGPNERRRRSPRGPRWRRRPPDVANTCEGSYVTRPSDPVVDQIRPRCPGYAVTCGRARPRRRTVKPLGAHVGDGRALPDRGPPLRRVGSVPHTRRDVAVAPVHVVPGVADVVVPHHVARCAFSGGGTDPLVQAVPRTPCVGAALRGWSDFRDDGPCSDADLTLPTNLAGRRMCFGCTAKSGS